MTAKHHFSEELGPMRAAVDLALAHLAGKRVLKRLWRRDHSLWSPSPETVDDRLGWLDVAERMAPEIGRYDDVARDLRSAGFSRALLLGMGGSSCAADFYRRTFGVGEGFLDLSVLDTIDPAAIREWTDMIEPESTLWVVSSKSGDTIETLSLLKHFYGQASARLGESRAGAHFIALTDPESPLAGLAADWSFRATFFGDSDVCGPFSALSPFGLVPAALIGVDLRRLLERAREMSERCGPDVDVEANPGAWLGVIMSELAKAGRDKLTLLLSKEELGQSFGDWVEQLLAGSTGKDGRGILPIVGEPLAPPAAYGPDRLFVCLNCEGESNLEDELALLTASGHPLIQITLTDPYDLGGQLFLWQLASVVASYLLQVNPFEQPQADAAKSAAWQLVENFKAQGDLPRDPPALSDGLLSVFGDVRAETPVEAFKAFLARFRPPEYLAVHAYLRPDTTTSNQLAALRTRLRDELGVAVTVGYGPRFLHSTGQLHKGDGGHGRFLQLTANDTQDLPIPDEMGFQQGVVSFGVLKMALAMGDAQALIEAGKKVLRVHLGDDVSTGLTVLTRAFDAHRTSSIPPGGGL